MGLLQSVGKRTRETKILVAVIYTLLIAGGVTMVYPFLIMISGSFKSDVDLRDYDVLPSYFHRTDVLLRKYLESRYNESVISYNRIARQQVFSFQHVVPPKAIQQQRVADWREFRAQTPLPPGWTILGHSFSVGDRMFPEMARTYRAWMVERCGDSLETFHREYGGLVTSWLNVSYPIQSPGERSFKRTGSAIERAQMEFKSQQSRRHLIPLSLDGKFVRDFLQLKYGRDIKGYNRSHGTSHGSYAEIFLAAAVPAPGRQRADWVEFVRNEINIQFLRVSPAARGEFSAFLARRYEHNVSLLNKTYRSQYGGFSEVPYPEDLLASGNRLVDWELFTREVALRHLTVTSPEFLWREFLRGKYGGRLTELNGAHEAAYVSFNRIPMPVVEADYLEVQERAWPLRWEFATRNYRHVIQFFLLHGRGLWNTFVFCALSVLSALIVNPVAAYAMSRFNLPSTYKVLLFLLATMAFPPMVTAIPNFLLLKELGMLNTFWALVLPGVVNGYAIFLLKGFFDSLPRELYDSAQIDGAGEWTLFWRITMNLSKPILAVIALGAFNAAYGAFVFAFIVCQDEKMWTLMVWLYQLQQYSHQSVVFAALLIASIPTFLVFVFCQNLIMRGIVIPIEK